MTIKAPKGGGKVWKYEISNFGTYTLLMPKGAQILPHVEIHQGAVCFWALVNTRTDQEEDRTVFLAKTGYDGVPECAVYIGTVIANGIVGHLFEV